MRCCALAINYIQCVFTSTSGVSRVFKLSCATQNTIMHTLDNTTERGGQKIEERDWEGEREREWESGKSSMRHWIRVHWMNDISTATTKNADSIGVSGDTHIKSMDPITINTTIATAFHFLLFFYPLFYIIYCCCCCCCSVHKYTLFV